MSDQRTKTLLLHVLEDLSDIQEFVAGASQEAFVSNKMMHKAVCQSLLNVGEAIKSLPQAFLDQNPEIPWKSIVAMRNHTAHGYHSLQLDIVWAIATHDVPRLIPVIKRELKNIREREQQEQE